MKDIFDLLQEATQRREENAREREKITATAQNFLADLDNFCRSRGMCLVPVAHGNADTSLEVVKYSLEAMEAANEAAVNFGSFGF